MAKLPKVKRAKGMEIPSLGLGTWLLRGNLCVKTVRKAIELGYRHIDTARIYENEREVGVAIRESKIDREEIFITTKIWRSDLSYERVFSEVRRSLELLGTDYIDLLLIHWPNPEIQLAETLSAFRELWREGVVKHIGTSNFQLLLLSKALNIAPEIACTQEECHPWLPRTDVEKFCEQNKLLLVAYSPFAHDTSVFADPVIQSLARKYRRSPAQVVLNWLVKRGSVVAIPKASKVEHLKENLEALEWELGDEDFRRIFQITRRRAAIAEA